MLGVLLASFSQKKKIEYIFGLKMLYFDVLVYNSVFTHGFANKCFCVLTWRTNVHLNPNTHSTITHP